MKKAGAVLHLKEEKAVILESEVPMKETSSGHFTLTIRQPLQGVEFVKIVDETVESEKRITDCLVALASELTYKDVVKLHQVFGHVSTKKLEKLIRDSNKLTDEVKGFLEEVEEKCKSCKLHQKAKPRPANSPGIQI